MKYMTAFFRENRAFLLFTLLSPLLFLTVFLLYGLELQPFLYAGILYIIGWAVAWGLRSRRFTQACAAREGLLSSIRNGIDELPEPEDMTSAQWTDMLQALRSRLRETQDARTCERQEMQDYCTMWVHQIKTPIAAQRMLLQTGGDAMAIEAELFRIEQYAQMTLQFLRLSEGTGDLVFRQVPLDGVIRACIRKYAPLFIAKGLRVKYEGTAMTALTDEKWLAFILEQLLSNAVKYTTAGAVTITVTDDLCVTVADTGIGILPQDLPRIFEKGFTGRNGRLDRQATGLGLYLCGKAAAKLGIRLTAESTVGQGSAFTLCLINETLPVD